MSSEFGWSGPCSPLPCKRNGARHRRKEAAEWGFALNPKVGLQVEDGFDERRRIGNPEKRGTLLRRNEHRACRAIGTELAGAKLARHNCGGQRPRRLAAQVAAWGRVNKVNRSRCCVWRATRHRGRQMMRMGHRGMALPRLAGNGEHRQSTLRPQADAQRHGQRQESPHCALQTHAGSILARELTRRL